MIRGEDKALTITITDSLGVLQDIDSMTDLIVYVYSNKGNPPLIKFKKVASTGYSALLRVSATEYTAIIPKAITSTMLLDNVFAEIEIQEVDSRFTDSIRRTKGSAKITTVIDSIITD
jgi:hypothetical protein